MVATATGSLDWGAGVSVFGVAAALAQVAVGPGSAVPMVGASGAISGVMGAYIVLYPRVRVHTLVPLIIFFFRVTVPAWTSPCSSSSSPM